MPLAVGATLSQQFVTSGAISELLVAADIIAEQARNFTAVAHAKVTVTTVGQPTLESWKAVAADQTAAITLRRKILGNSVEPTLLFFGGYGEGYNDSVRLLGAAIAPGGPLSAYSCILTPHPGQGGLGQVERSIFAQLKLPPSRVKIVTSNIATSPQVAAFSNLTASDDSTCGVQSLFIGVPSMYMDPRPEGSFVDVAVATDLIAVTRTRADILRVATGAQAAGWRFDPKRLVAAGIPSDAAKRIAAVVSRPLRLPCPY